MNQDIIAGNWKQLKGKIQAKWGDLTDDDFQVVEGNAEYLEGRLQERELVTDRPGRAFDSYGTGRHGEDPATAATTHEAENFALELSRFLQKARTERRYDTLMLMAAPAFLGELRERLDVPTRDCVMLEIDKNLVQRNAAEIRGHLPDKLYSAVGA